MLNLIKAIASECLCIISLKLIGKKRKCIYCNQSLIIHDYNGNHLITCDKKYHYCEIYTVSFPPKLNAIQISNMKSFYKFYRNGKVFISNERLNKYSSSEIEIYNIEKYFQNTKLLLKLIEKLELLE
ncbi:MAG: hypothetical protein LC122_12065 [Chitinophagales bacterium]|nr:hypothetical protein [Chitinophagales bacterium]